MNEEIRVKEIRLVDESGNQLGILPLREGLRLAEEKGLDLVEVAPMARPPVCRLIDYGKFKYEQSKREKEARKKQKVTDIKEIKMTPKIEGHDFQVKIRNAQRFLNDGNKVKATVKFRGREIVHPEIGKALLKEFAEEIGEIAVIEREPRLEGRNMVMFLGPKQ